MSDPRKWEIKFKALRSELAMLGEECERGAWAEERDPRPPLECVSAGEDFFVRNDLEGAVDNEAAAVKYWGKGTYFRVTRTH